MGYMDYVNMPFHELFYTIFTSNGEMKACGRDACKALIKRLERCYGKYGLYGNIVIGKLNLPEAYTAAKQLMEANPDC